MALVLNIKRSGHKLILTKGTIPTSNQLRVAEGGAGRHGHRNLVHFIKSRFAALCWIFNKKAKGISAFLHPISENQFSKAEEWQQPWPQGGERKERKKKGKDARDDGLNYQQGKSHKAQGIVRIMENKV